MSTQPPQLAFIVGMPRSGTTWLGRRLQQIDGVTLLPETGFWGRWFFEPAADGRYPRATLQRLVDRLTDCLEHHIGIETTSYRRLTAEGCRTAVEEALAGLANPTPAETFAALASHLAEIESSSMVIEKSPHHLHWIDRISDGFPEARFVILIREPEGFLLSYKHQGDRMEAEDRVFFRRLYHPLVCVWRWRRTLRAAERVSQRHPEHTLLVRFDEITDEPAATLARVQAFLGLPTAALPIERLEFDSSFPSGCRPRPDRSDRAWLSALTSEPASTYGWTPTDGSGTLLAAVVSLLTLPWWALRGALALRGRAVSHRYFLSWFSR